MSSRREQKEALRREREQREKEAQAAAARKRLVGYGGGGLLVIAVVLVLVFALGGGGDSGGSVDPDVLPGGGSVPEQTEFDLKAAAKSAGCELKDVKATGNFDHTTDPNERVKYNSNPPTSGRHYVVPADDGAYTTSPTDEQLVHELEHGRVIIWFKPSLPEDTRAELKALFDEDTYQMVLTPRPNMPYQVAASAWNGTPEPSGMGRLITCASVQPEMWDALRAFRDEHRSNGPEPVP
ncbi:MAG: DUF3105 domain-containing protein [Thermoleophilaceae bacterium]|nr:DUF3105 domain-containing protein [Thermoleophilaceae bacterium]